MAHERRKQEYEITWLIRRLFRAMSQEADRYLSKSGLTAADRAVMEFLYPDKNLTVPAIAGLYDVSRQHVQVVVNGLQDKGLLLTGPNPNHKRSQLLRLSANGRKRFAAIRKSESAIVNRLFAEISDKNLEISRRTLESMYRQLKLEDGNQP